MYDNSIREIGKGCDGGCGLPHPPSQPLSSDVRDSRTVADTAVRIVGVLVMVSMLGVIMLTVVVPMVIPLLLKWLQ
jgi:hypothetical protein